MIWCFGLLFRCDDSVKWFAAKGQHVLCFSLTDNRHSKVGDGRLTSGRDPQGIGEALLLPLFAENLSCALIYLFPFLPPAGLTLPEWNTASPSSEPPVTSVSEKDNSWLYTLDPILVTIIVMSSLGVLLGAVCAGLLLYCTCSYSGLSSRSSTTLENYNFELYDGLKHKVKLNQQRCCTEA